MNIGEYSKYDGLGLAGLVRSKSVSPKELAQTALTAIDAINPKINAVVAKIPDWEEAFDKQPTDGPFYGVPFLIKDLFIRAKGVPSDMGCEMVRGGFVAPFDSDLMARFRQAGLNTLGRTNTPELGYNSTTEPVSGGATLNPWDTRRSPGGSSGGSAAAVAAGVVPMAHGTDGGGSMRIPAANCGIIGLKTTRGRISVGPYFGNPLAGMAVESVLTKSVRDLAAILDAVEGPGTGDRFMIGRPARPYKDEIAAKPRKLRIAFHAEGGLHAKADPECVAALERTAKLSESLGHHVERAVPQFDEALFHASNMRYWFSFAASGTAALGAFTGRKPSLENLEACNFKTYQRGLELSAMDMEEADDWMNTVCRQVAPFFTKYDVLLTPVMAAPPLKLGVLNSNDPNLSAEEFYREIFKHAPFTALFNMTGQPAISLPLAESESGLPIGMQFVAPYGDEATLLALASELEAARAFGRNLPKVHASKAAVA
jgi:amidase